MSDLSHSLPVAETFYSLQGEGPSVGRPSVFLRLSYCNLRCPWCDTTSTWSKVWRWMTPDEITAYWSEQGWLSHLGALSRTGGAHLVVTGGEPLMWQSRLVPFLRQLRYSRLPWVEVETNATIVPTPEFDSYVDQYNCSPKLRSTGNPTKKAYVPKALEWFAGKGKAIFKFVVTCPTDFEEIRERYIERFVIWSGRVWIMPECSTLSELLERSEWVAEACKANNYNFSSRLQLVVWRKATGV